MGKIKDLIIVNLKFNPKTGYHLKIDKCEGTFKNGEEDVFLGLQENESGKSEELYVKKKDMGRIGIISPVGSIDVHLEVICKKKHLDRNILKLINYIKEYYTQLIGFFEAARKKAYEEEKNLQTIKEGFVL